MTDGVWRESFDGFAPRYMNEMLASYSACEAAFLVDELDVPAGVWWRRPVDLDEMEIMVVMRRPPA